MGLDEDRGGLTRYLESYLNRRYHLGRTLYHYRKYCRRPRRETIRVLDLVILELSLNIQVLPAPSIELAPSQPLPRVA